MSTQILLYSYLAKAGIEEYYSKFIKNGIDIEELFNLSMQEIFEKTEITKKVNKTIK
jgi:hypothetical protein